MTRKDKQLQDAPPARRGWVTPLSSEIGATGRDAFAKAGFADPSLILRWEEIAGADTARLTRPLRLTEGPKGGVLTLMAEPGAALFLQHDSRSLCERINSHLGREAVARLRFVQGKVAARSAPKAPPRISAPVPPADPARCYNGPEGIREALLGLAAARQSRIKTGQD